MVIVERVCNPWLQYWYDVLSFRALHPTDPLPPVSDQIKVSIAPPRFIGAHNAMENFKQLFPLEINQEKGSLKRPNTGDGSNDADKKLKVTLAPDGDGPSLHLGPTSTSIDVSLTVSEVNPLGTFASIVETLITSGVTMEPVSRSNIGERAVTDMIAWIKESIAGATSERSFQRGIQLLIALKRGCVSMARVGIFINADRSGSEQFNALLRDLKYQHGGFWQFAGHEVVSMESFGGIAVTDSKLTSLITIHDDPKYGATEEMIASFMGASGSHPDGGSANIPEHVDDDLADLDFS